MQRFVLNQRTINNIVDRYNHKDCKQGQTGYVFKVENGLCYKIISDFFEEYKEGKPIILTPQREKFEALVESFDTIRQDVKADLPIGLLTYNGVPIGDFQVYHKGYKTLQKALKNKELSNNNKLYIFEYLLDILKEFEKVGFVYEDFHWKNVLVKGEKVKLIDFDDINFNGIKPSNVCISYERFMLFMGAVSENEMFRSQIDNYIDIPGINSKKYTKDVCESVIKEYKRII